MTPVVHPGEVKDDVLLAQRIRTGDPEAENALFLQFAGHVRAMALMRTRDREAAREIVDDVIMAVVVALRRGSVVDTKRIAAFVHGTAVNVINNYRRNRRRGPALLSLDDERVEVPCTDGNLRAIDIEALRLHITRLSAVDRMVLALSLVEGLTPGQIARRLGLSAEVARQRKRRALVRLKLSLCGESRDADREPQ